MRTQKVLSLAVLCLTWSQYLAIEEHQPIPQTISAKYPPEEETKTFWKEEAQNRLFDELLVTPIDKQAKNVIIFLGDGMGVSTLTAAR